MSDLDLFISNGTYYFATNRKAADRFIPCGNAANAAYTCCLKGDVCLEDSVCFHPDGNSGGTTYIAGCTDPGFGSGAAACPHKGKFADQQIVGLVRCQDSDDSSEPDELWAGCPGDKDKTEMTGVPSPCSCSDPDYQGLFRQKPTIEAVATLPTALGQTVLFATNHAPSPSFAKMSSPRAGGSSTVTPSSTTIAISVPTTTRIGSTLVASAPTSSAAFVTDVPLSAKESTSDQQGLSAGAKAGIAVGVILVVLLSSALFFLAATLRHRHHRTSGGAAGAEAGPAAKAPLTTDGPATSASGPPPPPSASPYWNSRPDPATAPAASMSRDAVGSGNRGDEWFKPELAADESTTISSSSPDPAVLAAGGDGGQKGYLDRSNSPTLPPSEHHNSGSTMRDSRGSSVVSDTSSYRGGGFQQARRSPFWVSPQHSSIAGVAGVSAGNDEGSVPQGELAGFGGRAKAMEPISELHG
ncbi:hypothetical protein PG994_013268 [Apiospora phragmitis]|uniref:Uncharacterized protein n=1 Tax=Apiospora phragmitis TaxID=2905665 RepID=A0ABR1T9W6_9PEZI